MIDNSVFQKTLKDYLYDFRNGFSFNLYGLVPFNRSIILIIPSWNLIIWQRVTRCELVGWPLLQGSGRLIGLVL